ncbi:MAG: nucleotidyltransferase family protein [Muribaculaceae bacterium]|nr:nucleotidyltransferase family protein [Muribaculaceae bacterium]
MKAMVFAAGLGTRLKPLTLHRPKALVEVAGVTMLERVLMRLRQAGFNDVTVNVHHFAPMVIEFLSAHDNFGLDIHISDERDLLLDTGGGILAARQWLDGNEPFLVHNADILTNLNLDAFYHSHHGSDALATLLVKERETQRYFVFDHNDRLQGWINKKTGETRPEGFHHDPAVQHELAFGGLHVISPGIFPLLEQHAAQVGPVFSITPFYIEACREHIIRGYHPATPYRWLDVGKPETLALAEEEMRET